ncbi:MAG: DUF4174 domain-containing protein [Desulfococcaceae bacterium]
MPRMLGMTLALALATGCVAQENKVHFKEFQWENRLLLVFTRPGAPADFEERVVDHFDKLEAELDDRDMLYFIIPPTGDAVRSNWKRADEFDYDAIREKYNPAGEQFTVIVVGKDSGIKYRREDQFDLAEIFTLIDGMPMRQRELKVKERRPRLD